MNGVGASSAIDGGGEVIENVERGTQKENERTESVKPKGE